MKKENSITFRTTEWRMTQLTREAERFGIDRTEYIRQSILHFFLKSQTQDFENKPTYRHKKSKLTKWIRVSMNSDEQSILNSLSLSLHTRPSEIIRQSVQSYMDLTKSFN